jgi:hypothetical protein
MVMVAIGMSRLPFLDRQWMIEEDDLRTGGLYKINWSGTLARQGE